MTTLKYKNDQRAAAFAKLLAEMNDMADAVDRQGGSYKWSSISELIRDWRDQLHEALK